MIIFAVALIAVIAAQDLVKPDIVYKYTEAYERIWTDAGSGAKLSVAVWRAKNYQSEYCSLGDVLTDSYSSPSTKAVLVTQKKSGALVKPSSFSLVWNDGGSGADEDVAIYRMNAPSGYTCLGGVAVNSGSPDSSKYCCVKNEYIVRADTIEIWNDGGSGAKSDVSLWSVIRAGGDAYGIDAGTFIGVSGYSKPLSSAVYLLRADQSKVRDVWALSPSDDKPLNLYEVEDLKFIWNDAGSGASESVSIWRAESKAGYYPLGDIAVASYSKPKIGFLLKPKDVNSDSVRPPVSYVKIWNDAGSGADKDVQLWRVNCPAGYVSLGSVATDGSEPQLGDVYCVKMSDTSYGSAENWGYIWRDYNSGANADVSIYEALATDSNQQSVRGFGAVAKHDYPRPPYLLKKDSHNYWAEKPIAKIILNNVRYDLSKEKEQKAPSRIGSTELINYSDLQQKVTRNIGYSTTESSSFSFSQSIQVGVKLEINAGIPLVGGAKTTVSVSATSTFGTGSTKSETTSDSIAAWINVKAKSKINAVITGTEYKSDIPFTATITKVYYDETRGTAQITGVYKGVAVSDIKVIYGASEDLTEQDIRNFQQTMNN